MSEISTPPALLLVDDDRLVLATLARGLQPLGWEVHCAESAEEAREQLAAGLRPDLALLDIRLPADDGLTLAAEFQGHHRIPFLMLSAYSEDAMVEQAAQAGALGYLVKPLDPIQLAPMLHTALARARQESGLQTRNDQLQNALDTHREINVAVGIAMMQYRMSRAEAFEFLRTAARRQRRKLSDVAQEIIRSNEELHAQ